MNYKENDLFRSGEPRYLNACVGRNGGPYTLHAYSTGYFQAAEFLVEGVKADALTIDLAVYPITYNYRHAIELSLKDMIGRLPQLWDEQVAYKHTHDISKLWTQLRPYILRDANFHDDNTVPFMDKIIADLGEFDPTAEVFRFPTDRQAAFHLQESAYINIVVLSEAMGKVREIFETWFTAVCVLQDYKDEELAQYNFA